MDAQTKKQRILILGIKGIPFFTTDVNEPIEGDEKFTFQGDTYRIKSCDEVTHENQLQNVYLELETVE